MTTRSPHAETAPLTAPERPILDRAVGFGMAGLTAVGIHKGFHSEALGNPGEHLAVAELAVIPATLAMTGLRLQFTEARLSMARRGHTRAEQGEQEAERLVREGEDSFTRVLNRNNVPYETSHEADSYGPSLRDKIERAAHVTRQHISIKHPIRSLLSRVEPHDGYYATSSVTHQRNVKRMVKARNKMRMEQMEADHRRRVWGKPEVYDSGNGNYDPLTSNDLGTDLGWKRFFKHPRTRAEVKMYRKSVKLVHHAEHEAHEIAHQAHGNTVGRNEELAAYHKARQQKAAGRISKLEQKRADILAGNDRHSRAVRKMTQPLKSAARKVRSAVTS